MGLSLRGACVLSLWVVGCVSAPGDREVVEHQPPAPVEPPATPPEPPDNGEPATGNAALPDCDECTGPRMGMPNWECPDGTRGGPACKRVAEDECRWTVVDCPGTKRDPPADTPDTPETTELPVAEPEPPKPEPCGELPDVATLQTWKVVSVYKKYCAAVPNEAARKRFAPPKEILDLGDGTFISETADRGCFRARYKPCRKKCLPPATLIATPTGDIPISELRVGMPVWTLSVDGARLAATILETSRVAVGDSHVVVVVELADGRALEVSAGHPSIDGTGVEQLQVGASYDGSRITSVRMRPYDQPSTHDILPSGPTGYYWADGIAVGSTLVE